MSQLTGGALAGPRHQMITGDLVGSRGPKRRVPRLVLEDQPDLREIPQAS